MKYLIIGFMSTLFFSYNALALDVDKINKNIVSTIGSIIETDDFVESLSLVLDKEKTNLETPSIALVLSASTLQAAWSSDKTSLDMHLDVTSEKISESENKIFGSLGAELKTDTVPMSKFFFNKTDICLDVLKGNESQACINLTAEIKQSTNLKEQIIAYANAVNALRVETNLSLNKLIEDLKNETDQSKIEDLKDKIEQYTEDKEFFDDVKISSSDDTLKLDYSFTDEDGGHHTNYNLSVQYAAQSVNLNLTFEVVVQNRMFEMYKEFVIEYLTSFEEDSVKNRENVTFYVKKYIEVLKDLVTDRN